MHYQGPQYKMLSVVAAAIAIVAAAAETALFLLVAASVAWTEKGITINPHYTDTRYNDKIR